MIQCPHCGATNRDDVRFCSECGQLLSALDAEQEPTQDAAIRGLSLPKKQTGELQPLSSPDTPDDLPEDVPPWLEKLLIAQGLVELEEEEEKLTPPEDRVPVPLTLEEPVPPVEVEPEEWPLTPPETEEEIFQAELEETEGDELDWLQTLRAGGEDWDQEAEEAEPAPTPSEEDVSDWLRTLQEPDAEIAVEPPDVPESEIVEEESLDWLHVLSESDLEVEPPSFPTEESPPLAETLEAEDEGIPEWLRDLGMPEADVEPPPSPEEVPPLAEAPEVEGDQVPEWLSDLGELDLEEEPAATEEVPSGDDELPEGLSSEELELPGWLPTLRGEGFEEAAIALAEAEPSLEEPEGEEIPEWLQEIQRPEVAAEEPPSPGRLEEQEVEPSEPLPGTAPEVPDEEAGDGEEREEEEAEIPGWLRELRGMEPTSVEEALGEGAPPPEWLTQTPEPDATIEAGEVSVPDWLQGPVPAAEERIGVEKDRAVPDWLQEVDVPVFPEDEAEDKPPIDVPSWLEELPSPAEPSKGEEVPPFVGEDMEELAAIFEQPVPEEPVSEAGEEETEGLAQADIPDWLLALRPREAGEEPAEEQEIVELSGPLAGIKGVLLVEPIISLPHLTRPETVAVEAPPVSGDLFAEIVAQPPMSTAAVPPRKRARFLAGAQRVLIYLLMLAAVVAPFLMGPIYGPLDAAELRAGAVPFYALLDGRGAVSLTADSVVVVAFDYNPATSAELSLQARAIVEHLMRRGVRIMAISLYPEGAALAGDILDELATEQGYTYGKDYLHLGYLPNQPVSLRYFLDTGPVAEGATDYRDGQRIDTYAIAQGVEGFSSVGLVIELSGDEKTLRTWVEQIAAHTGVPLVAGVTAGAAPYIRPYLDSGQLKGLLVGLPGAAEYEAQAGRQGRAIDSLGSQVAAQGAIVLLILLGNLVHLVTRGGRK